MTYNEGSHIVTTPSDDQSESPRARPGDGSLRDQLLHDMSDGECLSLSHIDSFVTYNYSTEPLSARQARVLTTIGSLLTDGLVVVGEIVGGSDERVEPWKLSTQESQARLHELYVALYDDWDKWGWTTWFALTPEGERAAEPFKGNTS